MHQASATRLSTGRLYVGLAVRNTHTARHAVRLRKQPIRALLSFARSAGDFLWGAFAPIAEAL
jgi:hypothetical protein